MHILGGLACGMQSAAYSPLGISAQDSYVTVETCHGGVEAVRTFKCKLTTLSAYDTAFVVVDMWKANEESEVHKGTWPLIRQLRNYNFTVIHGAGSSVMKFPKYSQLQNEVKDLLGTDYCKNPQLFGGLGRKTVYGYSNRHVEACPKLPDSGPFSAWAFPDVTRAREHLVQWEDDFRYVLWKNKIKNVVFLGLALDNCLLHRPYGINALVRNGVSQFNIFVLENFTHGMPSYVDGVTREQKDKVLIKSLSYYSARIIPDRSLKFRPPVRKNALYRKLTSLNPISFGQR